MGLASVLVACHFTVYLPAASGVFGIAMSILPSVPIGIASPTSMGLPSLVTAKPADFISTGCANITWIMGRGAFTVALAAGSVMTACAAAPAGTLAATCTVAFISMPGIDAIPADFNLLSASTKKLPIETT